MRSSSALLLPVLLLSARAGAQGPGGAQGQHGPPGRTPGALYSVSGPIASDGSGADVAVLGDVDGDGVDDWMAGHVAPRSAGDPPELRVYSGASGAQLYALPGLGKFDPLYLESLVDLGDVDRDGVDDFCFGNANAPLGSAVNTGAVVVYSGATGAELYTRYGVGFFHGFGSSVAAVGDVDGDGSPDFVVGAIGTLDENAWLVSGADGEFLLDVQGPQGMGDIEFGWATAGLDDVDGDGAPDFAVGTRTGGLVNAYASTDGRLLWSATGGTSFGRRLATLGDVDGDGRRDLLVGEPGANRVQVVSGADGTTLLALDSPDGTSFGAAVGAAGDVDRDRIPDFLVGDPGYAQGCGRAQLFSGRHGRLLYEVVGARAGDGVGAGVAGGIDLDGDRFPDFLAGAPGVDGALGDEGAVGVWSGAPTTSHGNGGSSGR